MLKESGQSDYPYETDQQYGREPIEHTKYAWILLLVIEENQDHTTFLTH